jgi:hypothetical protein
MLVKKFGQTGCDRQKDQCCWQTEVEECPETLYVYRTCYSQPMQIYETADSTAMFKANINFNQCSTRLKNVSLQNSNATILTDFDKER